VAAPLTKNVAANMSRITRLRRTRADPRTRIDQEADHRLVAAGTKSAILVCRSTSSGESASRSCELPLSRVAPSWQLSLTG